MINKNKIKIGIFFSISTLFVCISQTSAYTFGIKSFDNTISNIQNIEKKYKVRLPIVGFIVDPWTTNIVTTINNLSKQLGKDRYYHITISPNKYSAEQVSQGIFDKQYLSVFSAIKKNDLKVIFRTMHEMNGGWYPRASNPETFKKAWIHVRNLSREAGLDTYNIQFDFSINHRDMPTKQEPTQSAQLIHCHDKDINKNKCYKFEDYYPGDQYVDIVGVSFYNRGKATSNRLRLTPNQIMFDPNRNTLIRLRKLNKPIFVDEVGTTAVFYTGAYNTIKSKEIYNTSFERKNIRLTQLKDFFQSESDVVGALYFNTDYTDGLVMPSIGEADRSIINLRKNKFYTGFNTLYNGSNNDFYKSDLFPLFNTFVFAVNNQKIWLPQSHKKDFLDTLQLIINQSKDPKEIQSKIESIDLKNISDRKLNLIITKIKEIYK